MPSEIASFEGGRAALASLGTSVLSRNASLAFTSRGVEEESLRLTRRWVEKDRSGINTLVPIEYRNDC